MHTRMLRTKDYYRCDACGLGACGLGLYSFPWTRHRCSDMRFHAIHPKYEAVSESVAIHGAPYVDMGEGVSICNPAEINATGSKVSIGDGCDIAAFVVLNVADSSDRCIGRSQEIRRAPIVIEDHVFVGSHCFIGGGVTIGHHSKVAAGTIIRKPMVIQPYSLVQMGNRRIVGPGGNTTYALTPLVREGYYAPPTS